MAKRMAKIKEDALKRRLAMLASFENSGYMTISEFAEKRRMTAAEKKSGKRLSRARISKMICMARKI